MISFKFLNTSLGILQTKITINHKNRYLNLAYKGYYEIELHYNCKVYCDTELICAVRVF